MNIFITPDMIELDLPRTLMNIFTVISINEPYTNAFLIHQLLINNS